MHINSGIPNRAFYLAAVGLGGNAWDGAGPIWYAALTSGIGADTDFAGSPPRRSRRRRRLAGGRAKRSRSRLGAGRRHRRARRHGRSGVGRGPRPRPRPS